MVNFNELAGTLEPMVKITEKEYDQLRRDSAKLAALLEAGVDNWEWNGETKVIK